MNAVQIGKKKPLDFVLRVYNVHMDFHGLMTYALSVRYVLFGLRVYNVCMDFHGFMTYA